MYEQNKKVNDLLKVEKQRKKNEKINDKKYEKLLISLPKLSGEKLKRTIKELKSLQLKTSFITKSQPISYFRDFSEKGGTFKNSLGVEIVVSGSKEVNKHKGISKDEAKIKLKELKELLDLTVINEEEFKIKSDPLKKIILKD